MSSQQHQAEALLPHHQKQKQKQHDDGRQHQLDLVGDDGGGGPRSFSWLTAAGFSFLTFNSGMAIYRSQGDGGAISFVVFSYADLVTLFLCLRAFETAEPGSAARGRIKVVVWLLTTALTLAFSYKVAAVMPVAVAVAVWLMAFATIVGGFYAFFFHDEKQQQQ